ncbi:MAG TPA: DUF5667 domain-containing protein [Anaerolineaceae bacterium]
MEEIPIKYETLIANALQDCLEASQSGENPAEVAQSRYPELVNELLPLITQATILSQASDHLQPDKDFLFRSSQALLQNIRNINSVSSGTRQGFSLFHQALFRLAAALVFILLVIVGMNQISIASASSLPEDALYPVKLIVEEFNLTFTFHPDKKASLAIEYADRRIQELDTLIINGDINKIKQVLENYQVKIEIITIYMVQPDGLSTPQKEAIILSLQEKLASHKLHLQSVLDSAPPQAREGIERALVVSQHGLDVAQGTISKTEKPTQASPPTKQPSDTPKAEKVLPKVTDTPEPTTVEKPSKTPKPRGNEPEFTETPVATKTKNEPGKPATQPGKAPTDKAPQNEKTKNLPEKPTKKP